MYDKGLHHIVFLLVIANMKKVFGTVDEILTVGKGNKVSKVAHLIDPHTLGQVSA